MHTDRPPLVSVLIYNYNYGRFLRQCFDSVLAQTYQNVEILFSDNASSDDSWQIAVEYNQRYPGKFFIARNRENFGHLGNQRNCYTNVRGKYYVLVGSDDMIDANYLTRAVAMMEAHQEAGLAIVHRAIMDEHGQVRHELPFYDQTCKIPAPKHAAVHMMASINPSISQIFYRTICTAETTRRASDAGTRYQGLRIIDFDIACQFAVLYLKEPLVFHRTHGGNDGVQATENLMDVLGAYVMNYDFQEKAQSLGLTEVAERLQPSILKNARLALRYCVSALEQDNDLLARRYFHLAFALAPSVSEDALYVTLQQYWSAQPPAHDLRHQIIEQYASKGRLASYAPPEGSIRLE